MRRFLLGEVVGLAACTLVACSGGDNGGSPVPSASGGSGSTAGGSGSIQASAGSSGVVSASGAFVTGATSGGSGSTGSSGVATAGSVTGSAGSGSMDAGTGATGATGTRGTTGTTGATGSSGTGATGAGGGSKDAGPVTTTPEAGPIATGNCAAAPADPLATPQAKNLLCYLYSIFGNHVLSGQQETSWSNPQGDIDFYSKNVGKFPAILGGDYLYPSGTTARAQAYWAAGGLTMIRYHMGAPPLSDSYNNAKTTPYNMAAVLTPGTPQNVSLLAKLDYVAGELMTLQNAKVAVILALFHEVQPNGWFWWASGTGAQYAHLWQLAFKYLTVTKGIHNALWLVPFSGSPNAGYFPGKAYADLAGPDEYSGPGGQPFTGQWKSTTPIVGTNFLIPLHETGAIPAPSSMFPSTAPWLLWNVWAGYESAPQNGVTYNTVASIQAAYASPYTITRDELPKF